MTKTERLKKINQYIDGDESSFSDDLIDIKFQFHDKGIERLNISNRNDFFSVLKLNQESLKNAISPLVTEFIKKSKLFDISINFLTYPVQKESTSVFISIHHKNKELCDLMIFDIKNPKTFQEFFDSLISEISQQTVLSIKNCIFTYQKESKKTKHKKNEIFYKSDFMTTFFKKYSQHLVFSNFWIDIVIKKKIKYLFKIKTNDKYIEFKQKAIPNSEEEMLKLFCDMEYIRVPYEDAKGHNILEIIEMDKLIGY